MLTAAYSKVWEGDRKLYEKYLDVCKDEFRTLRNGCVRSEVVDDNGPVIRRLGSGGSGGLEGFDGFDRGASSGGSGEVVFYGIRDVGRGSCACAGAGSGSERASEVVDVGKVERSCPGNSNSGRVVEAGEGGTPAAVHGESVGYGVADGLVDDGTGARGAGRDMFQAGMVGSWRSKKEVDDRVGEVAGVKADGSEVSEKTMRNRQWRKEKKEKKQRRKSVARTGGVIGNASWRQPLVVEEKSEARKTLEEKWVVENKLAKAKAEQELEVASKCDVAEIVRLRERKLKAAGERALVQIEKSHATLAATGNVPGVVPKGGYCTTIVDDPGLSDGSSPSCTISPDSSASMKEFKETQKKLLDFQKRCEDQQKEILVLKKKYRKEARGALDAGAEIALTWNFDDGPTESVKEFVKEIPYEVEQDRDIVIGQITLKKDFEAFYADDGCGGEVFDY